MPIGTTSPSPGGRLAYGATGAAGCRGPGPGRGHDDAHLERFVGGPRNGAPAWRRAGMGGATGSRTVGGGGRLLVASFDARRPLPPPPSCRSTMSGGCGPSAPSGKFGCVVSPRRCAHGCATAAPAVWPAGLQCPRCPFFFILLNGPRRICRAITSRWACGTSANRRPPSPGRAPQDMSGGSAQMGLWHLYAGQVDGVVFVVDLSDGQVASSSLLAVEGRGLMRRVGRGVARGGGRCGWQRRASPKRCWRP